MQLGEGINGVFDAARRDKAPRRAGVQPGPSAAKRLAYVEPCYPAITRTEHTHKSTARRVEGALYTIQPRDSRQPRLQKWGEGLVLGHGGFLFRGFLLNGNAP